MDTISPATPSEVLDAVQAALSGETALEVAGAGTKRAWGHPVAAARRLDMSGLCGITLYEPEELVMTARAGTPMAEIEAALAEHKQRLAFEPPDLGPLLGGPAGAGTIGGAVACNLSGPRRIQAGAARDHLLGFKAVSGRGEEFKSGGRVVKNVTGFDLSKLIAGSFGTLAVMTELTLKVLPAPDKTRTVLLYGADDATAVAALSAALKAPYEVSGAAHLPAAAAARSGVRYVSGERPVTAVRVEGPGPSVEARCAGLKSVLGAFGETEELHSANSAALWAEVRDVAPLVNEASPLWRVSVPPTEGPALAARLDPGAVGLYDWGGGELWIAAENVRGALDGGGHATLMRGPEEAKAALGVFQPPALGVARLAARIKDNFDPGHILNPGRIYPGK